MGRAILAADDLSAQIVTAIAAMASAVFSAIIVGYIQMRLAREQTAQANKHSLDLIREQFAVQDDYRLRQHQEAENADRLRVIEYVELLVPRLASISSIKWLGTDNANADELERYQVIKERLATTEVDPANPAKTLGTRIAFLTFQIAAAFRLALLARWTRPITPDHARFLDYWELDIEPIICSQRYPGSALLGREQLEIAAQDMLTLPKTTGVARPLNWFEFVETRLRQEHVFARLAERIRKNIYGIFDEEKHLVHRKALQCRLAIMGIYLIKLAEEAGVESWETQRNDFWRVVIEYYSHEKKNTLYSGWFVFKRGDVEEAAEKEPAGPIGEMTACQEILVEEGGPVEVGRAGYDDDFCKLEDLP